jgi:hypothetical protein
MAVTDFAAWRAMGLAAQPIGSRWVSNTSRGGHLTSTWATLASAPTTAAACSVTTSGAIQFGNGTSQRLHTIRARSGVGINSNLMNTLIADRLSHSGGLSGTSTAAQTTNLPTAALTRYTSGEGVLIGLEIYTAIGSTATDVSVSYTNQAGTAGRTSPLVRIGGTTFNQAATVILIPFQAGDTGVQSVESVTLSASTGTAGDFGVTLFKPLVWTISKPGGSPLDLAIEGGGNAPQVVDNACLAIFDITSSGSSLRAVELLIAEDQ